MPRQEALARARILITKQSSGIYSRGQINEIAHIMVDENHNRVKHACFLYGKRNGMISQYAICGCKDCAEKPKQKRLGDI
jgi:hypothetical protein